MRILAASPAPLTRALGLIGAMALAACAGSPAPSPLPSAQAAEPPRRTPAVPAPSERALLEDERNTIAVFEAASQATVFVTHTSLVRDPWRRQTVEVPSGTGSGFIWDSDGHVITNAHVVLSNGQRLSNRYRVTLSDGRTVEARLRGVDTYKDLAVLKLIDPPKGLTPVRLAPEGWQPRVGQKTLAIGNPFGLDQTLTTGIISAVGRDVQGFGGMTIQDMIQTDASINPGNSGGPLLDSQGQLIGVNTMIYSKSGSSAGIGFAVPIRTLRRAIPHLIETGQPRRLGLGVHYIDPLVLRRSGIRVDGLAIREVFTGSPADKAGLQGPTAGPRGTRLGDVILAADGKRVRAADDMYAVLDGREPGDNVTLRVLREGGEVEITVRLALLE